jgi:hypothetical protein
MPAGNRTGPGGWGPMTGHGLGYCAGYGAPGYANPAPGLRRGWGGGGGRGWRHWYYATGLPGWARYGNPPFEAYAPYRQRPSAEEETEFLKGQAEALKRELDAIARRLDELEKEA